MSTEPVDLLTPEQATVLSELRRLCKLKPIGMVAMVVTEHEGLVEYHPICTYPGVSPAELLGCCALLEHHVAWME